MWGIFFFGGGRGVSKPLFPERLADGRRPSKKNCIRWRKQTDSQTDGHHDSKTGWADSVKTFLTVLNGNF